MSDWKSLLSECRGRGVYNADGWSETGGEWIESWDPSNGELLGKVQAADRAAYDRTIEQAAASFLQWRLRPPPSRGELIRELGEELRRHKEPLGRLVSHECGKILSEGLGEVQEMIDMCDFAVGLSRQLYGKTMGSERPAHRLFEQWHPLGNVGIITSFNFPVAVWAWNAAVAVTCGNSVIWKPSPLAPLSALAVQQIAATVCERHDARGVMSLCVDAAGEAGRWLAEDVRVPLVSATGSCAMGRSVAQVVGRRLGRALLELGGNNAAIVAPSADLELALRAVVFAACGTAGQRCTTLRRLLLHRDIAERFTAQLQAAYANIRVGSPLDPHVLMGPLIHEGAVQQMEQAVERAVAEGGVVLFGGGRLGEGAPGHFVQPTLIQAHRDMAVIREETFAPILYLLTYETLDEAIELQNSVPQGLSSAIFTNDVRESEQFLGAAGSDCGIANVNIGTSGAEIGGAFGGEKDTGGGREAGSDAWKAYMRRQTCTINYGSELPLAQGVKFDL
ncbi:MAG: aldehyde dehydrogenase family protein [Planctomycetales bacterium]|nr:aldehyde dehydrogenase family protein [Planctomycetales bacterium]